MKKYIYTTILSLSLSTALLFEASHPFAFASSPIPSKVPSQNQQVKSIASILLKHALTYDIDERSINPKLPISEKITFTGFDSIEEKIKNFVDKQETIVLNFVGFPYKSMNTQRKVISATIDGAERHALEYLHQMLIEISKVYEPGAKLTIFTDGIVFCDLEGIKDHVVADYEKNLKQLAKDLPYIEIKTLSDLLPGKSPHEMRLIIEGYAPTSSQFQEKLDQDKSLQNEIVTLSRRTSFELDYPEGRIYTAHHPVEDIAKALTHRGMQYSSFLAAHRPKQAIRLSVHYQSDVSSKLGIKLSQSSYITPWHGILILNKEGVFQIMHQEDVPLDQYIPTYWNVNHLSLFLLQERRR